MRLAVAAFVLFAWLTVAVTGGVAHADSPPPSDAGSSSQGTAGSQQADSPGMPDTAEASKSVSPKRPGDLLDRLTRHLRPENRIRPTGGVNAENSNARRPSPGASGRDTEDRGAPPVVDGGNVENTGADDSTAADKNDTTVTPQPSEAPTAKPRLWVVPRVTHSDHTTDQTVGALKPLKQVEPSNRLRVATQQKQPSAGTVDTAPMAANLVPVDPTGPSTSAVTGGIDVPQLGRQGVGLISDVGVVTASVVYTVAHTVAQAFGPTDFLGVPYALATALANTAAAASRTLIGAPLDASSPGRFPVTYGVLDGLSFFNPQKPPPGANDDSITVTDEHPLPIILLNGTTATQGTNWSVGAPVLANAGYKVYTFNYGNVTGDPNSPIQATGDISRSAEELDAEIDRVLEETGAEKVILIGHSQGGGILPAYYINNVEGGADKVSQVIGIAPSNHGTDFNGLVGLFDVPIAGPLLVAFTNLLGPAFIQQTVGSDFQDVVYGEQDTNPNVLYTNIITRNDEIVTPYTQQALEGDNVTNIVLQDRYPAYPAGHLGVVLSPQVWDIVLDALEANPEANPQLHPDSAELAA